MFFFNLGHFQYALVHGICADKPFSFSPQVLSNNARRILTHSSSTLYALYDFNEIKFEHYGYVENIMQISLVVASSIVSKSLRCLLLKI